MENKCKECGITIPDDKEYCDNCYKKIHSYGSLEWLKQPLKKCPICGKEFLPAAQHSYKIRVVRNGNAKMVKVCSYTCMNKYETARAAKIKAAKEARKNGKCKEM